LSPKKDYINRGQVWIRSLPQVEESDQELIAKAKKHDKAAFTAIFDRYRDKILGYIYRYVGDYQKAEDLTVETFLNAYNSLSSYEERGLFSSWLYKIATNCAKKELGRKKRQSSEVSIETPATEDGNVTIGEMISDERSRPDYNLREEEFKDLIYKIVGNMEEKYKEVLLLCDVEGLTYDEAAKALHSNHVTIGTRLKRARKILHDLLLKHGYKV
jgi:RNA polymerase sigma-70 factor (ECF subfamily)